MIHKISIKIWDRYLDFDVDTDKDPLQEESLRRAADVINEKIRVMVLDYNADIQDVLSLLLLLQVKEDIVSEETGSRQSEQIMKQLSRLDSDLEEYLASR